MSVHFNSLHDDNYTPVKKEKARKPDKTDKVAKTALSNNPQENKKIRKERGKITLVPLEKSDPFYGTDLIVFKDNYTGTLPLNGIREIELKEIKEYLEAFQNDKTKFNFQNSDGTLKPSVYQALKFLMTRRLGRELILKIENFDKLKQIEVMGHTKHVVDVSVHYKFSVMRNISKIKNEINKTKRPPKIKPPKVKKIEAKLLLNPSELGEQSYFTIDSNGKRKETHGPFAIALAHELVHLLYAERGAGYDKQGPNLSLTDKRPEPKLHSREEQATITGLGSPIRMEASQKVDDDFFKDWDAKSNDYYEFNENNFLAAFNLPPRIDHLGK